MEGDGAFSFHIPLPNPKGPIRAFLDRVREVLSMPLPPHYAPHLNSLVSGAFDAQQRRTCPLVARGPGTKVPAVRAGAPLGQLSRCTVWEQCLVLVKAASTCPIPNGSCITPRSGAQAAGGRPRQIAPRVQRHPPHAET